MLKHMLPLSRLLRMVRLRMTRLRHLDLLCPVCEKGFRSQTVVFTSVGGTRTDFHRRATGAQTLPHLIHTCRRCGYTGATDNFGEDASVSPLLKARVWAELAPKLSGGAALGSDKYEAAAKIAEWQDSDAHRVADFLLRAAWCCVDEEDIEAERYFRRKAAWKLEEALASFDGVAREERAVLTYLVAELWRRVGDTRLAAQWFARVESEIVDANTQRWIVTAARQQRDCPREWFG